MPAPNKEGYSLLPLYRPSTPPQSSSIAPSSSPPAYPMSASFPLVDLPSENNLPNSLISASVINAPPSPTPGPCPNSTDFNQPDGTLSGTVCSRCGVCWAKVSQSGMACSQCSLDCASCVQEQCLHFPGPNGLPSSSSSSTCL
ncbi:hypothetical protein PENSPDRAFT_38430 [Peniophora sp. CONT]|nr:hypothetical protein PENSPDRAFT_38430 [Peniophora sp. CONT]